MKIFYHADDFGVTYDQSRSIMECFEHGKLNSVSIILNSPETEKSYELIDEYVKNGKIRCVAHLNFIEGKSVSDEVPHLVDDEGKLNCSFSYLLKAGTGKDKAIIREELKREIAAQLKRYTSLTGNRAISVDSHQHYHMIPIVWDALMEVLKEDGYVLKFIRVSVDPISPIVRKGLVFKVPAINYVKWMVLCVLRGRCLKHAEIPFSVPTFFGIPFTCRMTKDVVDKLLDDYIKTAEKRGTDLELMIHPGAVRNSDGLLDPSNKDLVEFYGSKYRDMEKEMLMSV